MCRGRGILGVEACTAHNAAAARAGDECGEVCGPRDAVRGAVGGEGWERERAGVAVGTMSLVRFLERGGGDDNLAV